MLNKRVIKAYIVEYQRFVTTIDVVKRKLDLIEEANYVFTGCRRAGKTYALYQIIQTMVDGETPADQILYINFEDERLLELTAEDLNGILEAYYELFPHQPVIFLDEVQNIEGWEKFVRRLADTKYKLFVTGSNAEMLSKDISSTLGGRFFVKEVFPLSFSEYLRFKNISFTEIDLISPRSFELKREFNRYFSEGGFPESLRYAFPREYLSNVYKKVLYGDILARHGIRSEHAFELLIKKLAETVGDETSNQRINNLLKAAGARISSNTLADYIQYCRDAYLLFKASNFLTKFAERESKKKYYFIDNGMLGLFLVNGNAQLLENFVFTCLLKNQGENIFYLRSTHEVDFYLPETETIIQVAYSLQHPETRKRELKGIETMQSHAPVKEALIITYDEEEDVKAGQLDVSVKPAWKWALENVF